MAISFLHRVSKSTLKEGMAIPLTCQDSWLRNIGKGEHVPIKLLFNNFEIEASLRRVNNVRGHLQFRYDKRIHQEFRSALGKMTEQADDPHNVVIEITEIGPHVFRIRPFSGIQEKQPYLSVVSPIFHEFDKASTTMIPEFFELSRAISTVSFQTDYRQADYNSAIRQKLTEDKWVSEQPVIKEMGLRCDFQKNGIWVEIEFGNARTYCQDYIKFLIASKYRDYRCGVLLCPVASFAGYLCDLGKNWAQQKRSSNNAKYSGMMTFEKAKRELPHLSHFLNAKVVIAGLSVCEHTFD